MVFAVQIPGEGGRFWGWRSYWGLLLRKKYVYCLYAAHYLQQQELECFVLRDAILLYSQLHFGLYLTSMVKVGLCTAVS